MPITMLLAEGAVDVSAITSAVTSMTETVMSVVTASLPIVLPVAGLILAATVGVRLFKRFAKG